MQRIHLRDERLLPQIREIHERFDRENARWLSYIAPADREKIENEDILQNLDAVYLHVFHLFVLPDELAYKVTLLTRMMLYTGFLHELIEDGMKSVEKNVQYRLLVGDQLMAEMMLLCAEDEAVNGLLAYLTKHSIALTEGMTERLLARKKGLPLTAEILSRTDAKYYEFAFYAAAFLSEKRGIELEKMRHFGLCYGLALEAVRHEMDAVPEACIPDWTLFKDSPEKDTLQNLLKSANALKNEEADAKIKMIILR